MYTAARSTSATPRPIRALFGLIRLNSGACRREPQPLASALCVETLTRASVAANTGHHLIAVTEARKVGEIAGHEVFRVVATDVVPIGPPRPRLSAQQAEDDRTYVAMLREITGSGVFHFSYTYDLTRSQQAQAKQAASKDTPLYKRVRRAVPPPPGRKRGVAYGQVERWGGRVMDQADERFFWNRYLLESLVDKSDKEAGSGVRWRTRHQGAAIC